MKLPKPALGDLWGGLAAMLVALPSAIAFGVTIYAPLGASYVADGALAGILGVAALGLVAPMLGGTNRLISAPCAPAAAVLSAFAIEFLHEGGNVQALFLMLSILAFLAGMLQILFGALSFGRLIEYMPYPVVSGYLTGVGLIIIGSQVPKFLGAEKSMPFWQALASPLLWQWPSLMVGTVTVLTMVYVPRVYSKIPAAIIALGAGVLTYWGISWFEPSMRVLEGNGLVVGALATGGNFSEAVGEHLQALRGVSMEQIRYALATALTLAVLLSIDTLKTCVVLDALTRTRHNSNRELIGQGAGNVAAALVGGMPGAGTMGATLVNLSSGAVTRYSGVFEGLLALIAFIALSSYISWVPVASLAGILIVIGVRMIDRHSLQFLKQRSTIKDFIVIAAVVMVALTVSLIAASGVGIILAVLLFMREQIGGSVIRRKVKCNETFSKRIRTQDEMEILVRNGERGVVVELQGSLFFGTANQLYTALEPELKIRDFLILDMRRIQSVDVTAVHMLDQIRDMMSERNGYLLFSQLPVNLPSGRNMQKYFDQVGLVRVKSPVKVFDELDEALEWVEDRILEESVCEMDEQHALLLNEFELFSGRTPETLAALERCLESRKFRAGEKIFGRGDQGDEIYLIRKGAVRIMLPISAIQRHHLGTFARGAFFGEMSFLDGSDRSADAEAFTDVEVYILSRKTFDKLSETHRKLSFNLMESIAAVLASRLRYTNAELRVLET